MQEPQPHEGTPHPCHKHTAHRIEACPLLPLVIHFFVLHRAALNCREHFEMSSCICEPLQAAACAPWGAPVVAWHLPAKRVHATFAREQACDGQKMTGKASRCRVMYTSFKALLCRLQHARDHGQRDHRDANLRVPQTASGWVGRLGSCQ